MGGFAGEFDDLEQTLWLLLTAESSSVFLVFLHFLFRDIYGITGWILPFKWPEWKNIADSSSEYIRVNQLLDWGDCLKYNAVL